MLSKDEVATLIKSTRDEMVLSYLQNAALALLIYDFFLVFSEEFEHLWKHPKKPPALLYVLARYVGLSSFVVPIAVGVGTPNCTGIMRFAGSSFAISQVAMNVMLILRTAMTCGFELRGWIMGVLGFFGIAPLIPEIWTVATYVCSTTELSRSHYLKNVYAHVLTLIFETLVLAFSLWRLIPKLRKYHGVYLWKFLFADSISSYILVVVFNLLFALMYYLSDPVLITVEAELSQPISIILISHFLLDIRGLLRPMNTSLELQALSIGEGSDEVNLKRTTSFLDEESRGENNVDRAIVPRSFALGSIENPHSELSFTTAVDITNAIPPGFSVSSLSLKPAEEMDSGDGPPEFVMHPVPSVHVEGCCKGSGMNFKTEICHNRSQTSQTDDQPRPVTVIDLADALLPKRAIGAQETNVLDCTASGSDVNDQFRTTTIIDLADAFPPKDAIGAHGIDMLDHAASDRPPSVDSEVDLADVHAHSFEEDNETSREDDIWLRTGRVHRVKRRFSLAWKPW